MGVFITKLVLGKNYDRPTLVFSNSGGQSLTNTDIVGRNSELRIWHFHFTYMDRFELISEPET